MNKKILNLGILAHVDAGKTTLTENILYHSHVVKSIGTVDKGTTITDSMELEKARGITIRSSTVSFNYKDIKINLIDTPGHADFIGEVERCLRVLDGVILVVSAVEGVQPQTRILFRHLQKMKIPVLIFINKIDRMGSNYVKTYQQICNQLSSNVILMQKIINEGSKECAVSNYYFQDEMFKQSIIESSEKLTAKFINDQKISDRDLDETLHQQILKSELYPIYAGTALKNIGVTELMDGIVSWLTNQNVSINNFENLSAYVYKVEYDEKGSKKAYFRIFSGEINVKDKVTVANSDNEIVINNLMSVVNGKQVKVSKVTKNDIGILIDVPKINCGDFLGEVYVQTGLTQWKEPMLQVKVFPNQLSERFNLLNALKILETEDPLLHLKIDQESLEIQLQLFGKLQIEIIKQLLKERFHLDVTLANTKTICKAKPLVSANARISIRDKDNNHHAGIEFEITPLEAGMKNQYETNVSFGYLKKPFQNAVEEGVKRALKDGLGDSIVDTKVTFVSAEFESVSSTPADYRRLAPLVIKKALKKAGIKKLEPIMTYLLVAPNIYERKIISALRKIEASIDDITATETEIVIHGEVTYDLSKDFKVDVSTITGGQGFFELEFLEYREIIKN